MEEESSKSEEQHVILFYKYHPLSKERDITELYRSALERLCQSLELQGRILVGCNDHQSEGINGTLSGKLPNVQAFTQALTKKTTEDCDLLPLFQQAITKFWEDCDNFYQQAKCDNPLVLEPSDFKWSSISSETSTLFPDLNIKLVNELIGTGGVLAGIPLEEVHQGYLTPAEWHERIHQQQQQDDDTVLIDCRNTKECQIGHFPGAMDPKTTTFNQFPTWVKQHSQTLANKKILMYCTGGIRCEKASAYIRREIPSVQEVRHLKGGIHKYLDQYGSQEECLWKGKNFVFDGRGAHGAAGAESSTSTTKVLAAASNSSSSASEIVGTCSYCPTPYDVFEPGCVCTVCREPTLVCPDCREKLREYHCHNHEHLQTCYFTDITPFARSELERQLNELEALVKEIAVGRKYKQKRNTLKKQCNKILRRLEELESHAATPSGDVSNNQVEFKCRNCEEVGCSGRCWGFHGLKRKRLLDKKQKLVGSSSTAGSVADSATISNNRKGEDDGAKSSNNNNAHLQERKAFERQTMIDELIHLHLAQPPSTGRDPHSGIRVPTPCTRALQTKTKGKWCGMALLQVIQEEFTELANTDALAKILGRGLLRVNETRVTSLEQAESFKLKNMDVISRIVHWHEPPVHIPSDHIGVQKISLPDVVRKEYGMLLEDDDDGATIYVCDKPSTVPVHPAGPYLSNCLTTMVEAQEGLTPKSLIPCHRIDRVTSGMTLCCTNVKVARQVQARIEEGSVQKQYLAKVHGKFPSSFEEIQQQGPPTTDVAEWKWWADADAKIIQVDAPIETVDPANGIRKITAKGKKSQSLFRFLAYDEESKTSMIACTPVTGRGHQLRVHLQWLGFSIVKDTQYGGGGSSQESESTSPLYPKNAGIQRVTETIQQQEGDEGLHLNSISPQDVQAAREICPSCCQKDATTSASFFTPAQLLQGGHEICLHAYRYRIPFSSKSKKKKSKQRLEEPSKDDVDRTDPPLAVVDFQVHVPYWAFATELLTDLPWPSRQDKKQ